MPNPKRRDDSHARKNKRRAHDFLTLQRSPSAPIVMNEATSPGMPALRLL